MLGLKSKSAPGTTFVVVQHVPAADPPVQAGKEWTRDEALRVFDGVIRSAPAGFFGPHTGASLRIVPAADWRRAQLAAALLES